MELQLKHKKVLVTVATKGIGRAIAETLLLEKAEVILNERSAKSLEDALCEIHTKIENVHVSVVVCYFSKPDEIDSLIQACGTQDILINNVGIFEPRDSLDIPDADWQRFPDVNVRSGVRLTRAFLPHMLKQNWGGILSISCESGTNILE